MQAFRMLRDTLPRHLRPTAPLALNFFVPLLPLTHTRQRHQRREVAIASRVTCEKGRWTTVEVDLRADNGFHRILALDARLVVVPRGTTAERMLHRRHRFDAE